MNHDTCHYCLESKNDIAINGQYLLKNGKFLCYRICSVCARELAGISTYTDKNARESFLTEVRKNAKKNPIYA